MAIRWLAPFLEIWKNAWNTKINNLLPVQGNVCVYITNGLFLTYIASWLAIWAQQVYNYNQLASYYVNIIKDFSTGRLYQCIRPRSVQFLIYKRPIHKQVWLRETENLSSVKLYSLDLYSHIQFTLFIATLFELRAVLRLVKRAGDILHNYLRPIKRSLLSFYESLYVSKANKLYLLFLTQNTAGGRRLSLFHSLMSKI